MGKLQEEQFWESNGDQKFGLSTFEVPIRFLTGETNYIVAALCTLLLQLFALY